MIGLRPHHLLCTQTYSGHGYDKKFVKNMDYIVDRLRNENLDIEITFGCDDICKGCPNKRENECITNDKVLEIDRKVIEKFNVREERVNYGDITNI